MRVNIVFLIFTLLGFLLFRGKNNPHYYSLSETVGGGFHRNRGVRRWNNSSNNNKKMQHIYFPCWWYSPRYISLLIFPSTCLAATVKQHKSEWTYPIFWTSFVDPYFSVGSCHSAMSGKLGINSQHQLCLLNEFDTAFQRLLANVWSLRNDWYKHLSWWKPSKRVSKTALPRLRLPLPLSHSSLSGKTTVWLLQMNWPISIFLEFKLKQFEALGNKHL